MADTGRRLRVGLAGAGRHSREIILPALCLAGIEIAGVAARHRASARDLAGLAGGVPAFAGVPAMIAGLDGQIDALVSILPADASEDAAYAAMDARLPIYSEKPLALSSAHLRRIEARNGAGQSVIMVGYNKRFAPAYRRAKELAHSPRFGGATALNLQWSMGSRYADADYFLRENAVHMFDLARFLMGEVADVHAVRDRSGPGIAMAVTLRFASGAIGSLQLDANGSFDHPGETLRLTGRGAVVEVGHVIECRLRKEGEPEQVWRPNHTVPIAATTSQVTSGFVGALAHFSHVVLSGRQCEADLASAIATMELAEQVAAQI